MPPRSQGPFLFPKTLVNGMIGTRRLKRANGPALRAEPADCAGSGRAAGQVPHSKGTRETVADLVPLPPTE
jgi:hypothetical protein